MSLKPSFAATNFIFNGEVPVHDEPLGLVVLSQESFVLFSASGIDLDPRFLAFNIDDQMVLDALIDARLRKLEFLVKQGVSVGNFYVRSPEGSVRCIYEGVRSPYYVQPGPSNTGHLD